MSSRPAERESMLPNIGIVSPPVGGASIIIPAASTATTSVIGHHIPTTIGSVTSGTRISLTPQAIRSPSGHSTATPGVTSIERPVGRPHSPSGLPNGSERGPIGIGPGVVVTRENRRKRAGE
ncbi:unnamed protein product [Protopolystoma xenopodis]|uniref:Uncharacterized protein n=1 Tax=Protopolystoma xenopodis TaxID=117903 RepID=A0A3S5CIJ6_9PLAT|nr:unnamed protein product [Protopolystoma xenopodis]